MSAILRFLDKVQRKENGCWEWTGGKNYAGYGVFRHGYHADGTRTLVRAHRFAYQLFVGEIPEGLVLHHRCGNRACVNPAHLEVTTNEDNSSRGIRNLTPSRCKCVHCGKEFWAKRPDRARFCSPACRHTSWLERGKHK